MCNVTTHGEKVSKVPIMTKTKVYTPAKLGTMDRPRDEAQHQDADVIRLHRGHAGHQELSPAQGRHRVAGRCEVIDGTINLV